MSKRVDPPFLDGWRHVSPTVRKPCPCGPEPYRLYELAPNPYCGCGAAFGEKGGRFNLPGYRTLYLCSTLKCCIAEFNKGSLWALPRRLLSSGHRTCRYSAFKQRSHPGTGMNTGQEAALGDSLVPSYQGDNLVNLMAELETSLTVQSPTQGLGSTPRNPCSG